LKKSETSATSAITPAIAAPGTPTGLRYGRSMFGSLRRSMMNARHCMK
jgi:hypothetical protein